MFKKALLTTAAAIAMLALSSVARADTINIVGSSTGSLSTDTVNCSYNAQTKTFTFTVHNTSAFDARITGIGFDLPPGGNAVNSGLNNFTGSVVFQPTGVGFAFANGDLDTVPQFNSAVLDFGFITGSNFAGGNPPSGLPPGINPGDEATFVVSGVDFGTLTEAEICTAISVRSQRVGATGEGSDGGTPGAAPEPM